MLNKLEVLGLVTVAFVGGYIKGHNNAVNKLKLGLANVIINDWKKEGESK